MPLTLSLVPHLFEPAALGYSHLLRNIYRSVKFEAVVCNSTADYKVS